MVGNGLVFSESEENKYLRDKQIETYKVYKLNKKFISLQKSPFKMQVMKLV